MHVFCFTASVVALFIFAFWPEIHEVVWRRWIRRQDPDDMSSWN